MRHRGRAPSEEVSACTYEQWFASSRFGELNRSAPAEWRCAFHELGGFKKAHLFELLRLRLGAHNLRVATGRWEGLSRSERTCERCSEGVVEDEFHMVFECSTYDCVRSKYQDLFDCVDMDLVSRGQQSIGCFHKPGVEEGCLLRRRVHVGA